MNLTDIRKLHTTGTAVPNIIYTADNGQRFIGISSGRLRLLETDTQVVNELIKDSPDLSLVAYTGEYADLLNTPKITLEEVLTNGYDAGGLKIKNLNRIEDSTAVFSVDIENRQLIDSTGLLWTLDWTNRLTGDSSGQTSIDWENRNLVNNTLTPTFNWQTLTFPTLAGATTQYLNIDTSGNIGTSATAPASLTSTYVGYGSGSNLLTGSTRFTYDGSTVSIKKNGTADYFRIVDASNVKQLYIDSTNQFAFNATGGPFYFGAFSNPAGGLCGFSIPSNVLMGLAAATLRVGFGGSGTYFASNAPAALLEVRGKANEVQCIIRGNGTQTTDVLRINNSAGTSKIFVDQNYDLNFAAVNFATDTTTGTKFGTGTTQKIGFWNTAPIVQPTVAVAASVLVPNGGANITDTDTFDGYTLKQVVKALRNIGLLA